MPRRHGCQAPCRPSQVAALFVWFSTVAGFYALFIPVLSSVAWQATAAALYTAATIAVFCTYFAVSCIDPADDSTDGPLYCDYCQAFVQRGSRHCKECHKCVLGFDHHCKWVNNCIGTKNYRTFMVLLTGMCTMLTVQLATGIDDLVECFSAAEAMHVRLQTAYPVPVSRDGYIAAMFCYLAVVLVALYGLGDLWLLHIVLIIRGMTTYEYIMANHDAALAAAAEAGQTEPSQLSTSWKQLRSLGPRSSRVRDESVLLEGSRGISPSSSNGRKLGPLLSPTKKKHHVSLTPCSACMTPRGAIAARQHALAYREPLRSRSLPSSPRAVQLKSSSAGPMPGEDATTAAAGAFDAAASTRQAMLDRQHHQQPVQQHGLLQSPTNGAAGGQAVTSPAPGTHHGPGPPPVPAALTEEQGQQQVTASLADSQPHSPGAAAGGSRRTTGQRRQEWAAAGHKPSVKFAAQEQ